MPTKLGEPLRSGSREMSRQLGQRLQITAAQLNFPNENY
jgi:hypothetical protein